MLGGIQTCDRSSHDSRTSSCTPSISSNGASARLHWPSPSTRRSPSWTASARPFQLVSTMTTVKRAKSGYRVGTRARARRAQTVSSGEISHCKLRVWMWSVRWESPGSGMGDFSRKAERDSRNVPVLVVLDWNVRCEVRASLRVREVSETQVDSALNRAAWNVAARGKRSGLI